MAQGSNLVPFNATGSNLEEFEFEKTLKKNLEFPDSGGGTVVFKRSKLVKRMVDTFVSKYEGEYSNFYFHHAAGTGKTVLMKLFGKELQERGFIVYMLTAPEFIYIEKDYFDRLLSKVEGKQVAVLVDEVHRNVNAYHWDLLLKGAPKNLLVIGAGISDLMFQSPQFKNKFPSDDNPSIGQLTEEDMPEVLDHFIPKTDPQK